MSDVTPSPAPSTTWKPGARHMVELLTSDRWRCVDCGQEFDGWPPDSEECPGPAPSTGPEERCPTCGLTRLYARVASHLDILDHFCRTDPDLVRARLAEFPDAVTSPELAALGLPHHPEPRP